MVMALKPPDRMALSAWVTLVVLALLLVSWAR
jgi:hypothetical protein